MSSKNFFSTLSAPKYWRLLGSATPEHAVLLISLKAQGLSLHHCVDSGNLQEVWPRFSVKSYCCRCVKTAVRNTGSFCRPSFCYKGIKPGHPAAARNDVEAAEFLPLPRHPTKRMLFNPFHHYPFSCHNENELAFLNNLHEPERITCKRACALEAKVNFGACNRLIDGT